MTTFVSPLAFAATVGANLPDIAPAFDAPWMPTLNNIASMVLGTVLVVLVIGVGISVVIWVLGKLSSSGRAQDVGVTFIIWTLIGAAIAGSAAGLVGWGMGLPLF